MSNDYDSVFSYRNLLKSSFKCRKGVSWKGSVQNFFNHLITNLYRIYTALMDRRFKTGEFFKFVRMERGKVRHIKSVRINERVVQRCLCDNCLVPLLSSRFIYDNSACIKGKGMHFAIRRLKRFLHRFWLKYGSFDGYILQFDFHSYFDSIPHSAMEDMACSLIKDEDIQGIYRQLVDDFGTDKGLGLGSQISQISALYYPHTIDEYMVSSGSVFAYARYMDDGYAILKDKRDAILCMEKLKSMCDNLSIGLNPNKTHIAKLKSPFEFLKSRISVRRNGSVIVKPNRKNVTRNRRKIRKLVRMAAEGVVEWDSVDVVFKTTYGSLKGFDAYMTARNYLNLYKGEKTNEIHRLQIIQRKRPMRSNQSFQRHTLRGYRQRYHHRQ